MPWSLGGQFIGDNMLFRLPHGWSLRQSLVGLLELAVTTCLGLSVFSADEGHREVCAALLALHSTPAEANFRNIDKIREANARIRSEAAKVAPLRMTTSSLRMRRPWQRR